MTNVDTSPTANVVMNPTPIVVPTPASMVPIAGQTSTRPVSSNPYQSPGTSSVRYSQYLNTLSSAQTFCTANSSIANMANVVPYLRYPGGVIPSNLNGWQAYCFGKQCCTVIQSWSNSYPGWHSIMANSASDSTLSGAAYVPQG
jgi:hypothetical protein